MATWGIHHSCLSVSDEEASLRFYRDGLGLKVVSVQVEETERLAEQVEVEGAAVRCLWLETPGSNTLLELIIYQKPKGKKFDLACNDIGAPHLSFLVDDIDETCEKLWSMGYRSTSPAPQDVDPNLQPGAKTIYFRDPDGIAVEIFQLSPELRAQNRFYR